MNGFGRTYQQAKFEDNFSAGDSDPGWEDELAEVVVDEERHDGPPMEDSVQLYLREIGQVALLNAVDEYRLAQGSGQVRRTTPQLEQVREREPTPDEIAQALGISQRKVLRLMQAAAQPVSLEQPLGNEGEGRVGEFLADESDTPGEIATQRMLQE